MAFSDTRWRPQLEVAASHDPTRRHYRSATKERVNVKPGTTDSEPRGAAQFMQTMNSADVFVGNSTYGTSRSWAALTSGGGGLASMSVGATQQVFSLPGWDPTRDPEPMYVLQAQLASVVYGFVTLHSPHPTAQCGAQQCQEAP